MLQTAPGPNFGSAPTGVNISGCVFYDLNLDGHEQRVEKGQPGVTVYIDLNNNWKLDTGEPETVSASCPYYWSCYPYTSNREGSYEFSLTSALPAGAVVREIPPLGYMETGPQAWGDSYSDYNSYKTSPVTGEFSHFDFGNIFGPPCASGGVSPSTTPGAFVYAQVAAECPLPCTQILQQDPILVSPVKAYVSGGCPWHATPEHEAYPLDIVDGRVFFDGNNNGQMDKSASDPPMPGTVVSVTVYLKPNGSSCGTGPAPGDVQTAVDANGNYRLVFSGSLLPAKVCQVPPIQPVPPGWSWHTTMPSGDLPSPDDWSAVGYYDLPTGSSGWFTGFNFGNLPGP